MTISPTDVLGDGGLVARRMPQFESRPQQLEMAQAVESAIAEQRHLVVEAGTGTGKSFAYLVPAILAASARRPGSEGGKSKPIIISTHTISLQEQLVDRDIPFLNAVMPVEFSAVLAKGRSNYISLRRLKGAVEKHRSLFATDEEDRQLARVAEWSGKTTDGSRADLDFQPFSVVWDEVRSEHGNCLGRNCPTYESCFYYKARRRVWNANVVIVNHALFFADLALRREGAQVLPDYDVVIFDEAHTLEQVAADHLGASVSSGQLEYLLGRLYNDRTQKGLMIRANDIAGQKLVDSARHAGRDLFEELRDWTHRKASSNGRLRQPPPLPNEVSPLLNELAATLTRLATDQETDEEKIEYAAAADRCTGFAQTLTGWMEQRIEGSVYWLETSGKRQERIELNSSPIDVGPILAEELFNSVKTAVLTSATLAVGEDDFGFIRQRLGLTRAEELKLGSPFNFREQVTLRLPSGLPDPGESPAQFESAACDRIREYIELTRGRAFVLFTSYRMLQLCVQRLMPWLTRENYGCYVQGQELQRSAMIEKFRNDPAGVLFGTDSFWQGVDVPGEALQNVIITKLPFTVPDHPLLEARVESIRARGGNPFFEYQVPEAVIKLKQGFGRLIRTRTDYGIVVILDPRVSTKRYGKLFLNSLPDCRIQHD